MPSCLFEGFPLVGFEKAIIRSLQTVEWDNLLQEIQKTVKEKSVKVEATLTGKTILPGPEQEMTCATEAIKRIMAEGKGTIRRTTESIPFLWSLVFSMWDTDSTSEDPIKDSQDIISLDFLGFDTRIPSHIVQALKEKILICSDPEAWISGMPTLQGLTSVVRVEQALGNIVESISKGKDLDLIETELSDLALVLESCWSVGETREFTILEEPPEWLRQLSS